MHLQNLSLLLLVAIFAAGAVAIWIAGTYLSKSTDILSRRFGLGEALGGMILLAFVTNLPEIAIVISAAAQHKVSLAVGNILGGISIQTVVLVVLDAFGASKTSLTYQSSSLTRALEAMLVIAVLSVVVMGHQLPASLTFFRCTPQSLLIVIVWIAGLKLIAKAGKGLPWQLKQNNDQQQDKKDKNGEMKKKSTGYVLATFITTAIVTLVAGLALERSSDVISGKIGMDGVLFGATVLAAATSLPEVSTGLAAMKAKQYELAVSDIFGGNAFLPVLFVLAAVISGNSVIPAANKADIYLTGLAIMLTGIYIWGIIFKSPKKILAMGIDSFIVLLTYIAGVAGLFAVASGS